MAPRALKLVLFVHRPVPLTSVPPTPEESSRPWNSPSLAATCERLQPPHHASDTKMALIGNGVAPCLDGSGAPIGVRSIRPSQSAPRWCECSRRSNGGSPHHGHTGRTASVDRETSPLRAPRVADRSHNNTVTATPKTRRTPLRASRTSSMVPRERNAAQRRSASRTNVERAKVGDGDARCHHPAARSASWPTQGHAKTPTTLPGSN